MRTYKRLRNQYLFGIVLGVVAVINVLFFFILYAPVRSEYFRLQDSIQKTRADVYSRHATIDRLEKLNAQLETSAQDRQRLYTSHFIPKSSGWSEILPQLDAMIQRAGVRNTRKNYGIAEAPQYGLYSVKITLPVVGVYSNVVNLIKEIENSDTFFIIESIDVRGAGDARGASAAGSQDISMNLNLETFFYQ